MSEIWKDIQGYEGLYQVSNLGRVKSLDRRDRCGRFKEGKIKSICDNGNGYCVVNLKVDGEQKSRTVHRLVATAFIPNPKNLPEINHIDGNKKNNTMSNLEWCDRSENVIHAVKNQLHTNFGQRKVVCVELNKEFNSVAEAEKWIGVKGSRISNVCKLKRGCKTCGGYHWRYVEC